MKTIIPGAVQAPSAYPVVSLSILTALSILLLGCNKQGVSPTTSPPATEPQPNTTSMSGAIAEPAMNDWQQGDKESAVEKFIATDWSARPLFAPNSPLSLSEEQFNAFSEAENKVKSAELLSQLDSLKQLARAVIEKGEAAVAKGDREQARKCFTSLDQCGTALNSTKNARLVQLVGQALQKHARSELPRTGQ